VSFKEPAIVTSPVNICGRNIRKALLELLDWEETSESFDGNPILRHKNIRLVLSKKDIIETDNCDSLGADLLIFGSRHKSEAQRASLLTHVPGNLGKDNSYGGNPLELAVASTRAIREAYLTLKQEHAVTPELESFDVTVEATHHGPTNMQTPLIFIEVGSTITEYQNPFAIHAVAKTILSLCTNKPTQEIIPSICFGGGHYATRFNELMELTSVAVGHILPKYQKDNLTVEIVEQMIAKTIEPVRLAIVDRSSLNAKQIQVIKDACSPYDIEVVKAKDVKYGKVL